MVRKYIILLGDGMSDRPLPALDGQTPLMLARTPHMDAIASRGLFGMARTACNGYPPGSDIMNLNILGYPPEEHYTGRAPLEAASIGVPMEDSDVAFRVNLVTLAAGDDGAVMDDYSAGHISTGESSELIREIQKQMGDWACSFYPGKSYRHLMIWHNGPSGLNLAPPHDIMDEKVNDHLPGERKLVEFLEKSRELLAGHRVNKKRVENGMKPANSLWFWGEGLKPQMPTFKEKWGLTGAMVSAVDLLKGVGVIAGLDVPEIEGATGYLDTNYQGKADAALRALEGGDFAFLHVEAPDEAGHNGNTDDKIKAIEDFDEKIVGPVLEGLKKHKSWKLLVMPDHATPIELRTHVEDPVPYAILTSKNPAEGETKRPYREIQSSDKGDVPNYLKNARQLNDLFFNEE